MIFWMVLYISVTWYFKSCPAQFFTCPVWRVEERSLHYLLKFFEINLYLIVRVDCVFSQPCGTVYVDMYARLCVPAHPFLQWQQRNLQKLVSCCVHTVYCILYELLRCCWLLHNSPTINPSCLIFQILNVCGQSLKVLLATRKKYMLFN